MRGIEGTESQKSILHKTNDKHPRKTSDPTSRPTTEIKIFFAQTLMALK